MAGGMGGWGPWSFLPLSLQVNHIQKGRCDPAFPWRNKSVASALEGPGVYPCKEGAYPRYTYVLKYLAGRYVA
ncbi:hypothetical protein BJY01DRAFT_228864 [Aspergillus pseudoustus]|uniref:Uncharacterized protein n=1 Tax=Aspergillus pseudoustus TaxID=1810923 RepID=A0ABR4ILW4_9EURO